MNKEGLNPVPESYTRTGDGFQLKVWIVFNNDMVITLFSSKSAAEDRAEKLQKTATNFSNQFPPPYYHVEGPFVIEDLL